MPSSVAELLLPTHDEFRFLGFAQCKKISYLRRKSPYFEKAVTKLLELHIKWDL
jgi:hypothetical protein